MPKRSVFDRIFLLSVVLTLLMAGVVEAQAPRPAETLRPGDAVVTGFAGIRPPGSDLPQDVHPLDRTAIDPEGVTVRVFDLSQLGGGPEGQLSDAPVRFTLKARQVGHVFGVAFDGDGTSRPPNLYLAASSFHGLQLMAPGPDGREQRVMTGRPGAQWMTGLFGEGGTPGTIYRVDGVTGAVSRLAEIRNGELENAGAGLGALAFDPRSRHLYVSDLETGLLWRIDLNGRVVDAFDHGTEGRAAAGLAIAPYDPQARTDRSEETFNTENPESWGFAPLERRILGLAVENGRLYYATADGPIIWSVGLAPDGSFQNDARQEIDVKGTPAGSQIGTILFDGPGVMILAQRGTQAGSYDYQTFMRPQEAAALRYQWNETERRWIETPQEYAVGMPPEHHGAVGGVALNYGYDRFGKIDLDRCRQTLWLTGEHLRAGSDIQRVARGGPRLVAGLQGIYKSKVRPANEPPFEAWFVDYDANYADEEIFGHIGNVAIYGPCRGNVTYSAERVEIPVWTRGPNLVVEKRCDPAPYGGRVLCHITVRNSGDQVGDGVIEIIDETRVLYGPWKGRIVTIAATTPDGGEWSCGPTQNGTLACALPAGLLAPGAARLLTVAVDTADLVLAGNAGFRNCVSIRHPHGQGRACAEGGTGITVAKTGPAVCEPGEDCTFALTLTNASPVPFKGPVLLSDHLLIDGKPVETPISKIEPPLACKDEPVATPFACVADVSLGPGESLVHKITLEMPGPGPTHAQNCFLATDPWFAGKAEALAGLVVPLKIKGLVAAGIGGHPSCLWIKLADPKTIAAPVKSISTPLLAGSFAPTPLGLLPPAIGLCANGLPPLAGGRCPCPASAPWDPVSGSCRWRPQCWDKARLTPDGDCCPRGTVWWASSDTCRPPPSAGCSDPWRRTPDGSCCPRGLRWRDGACRPPVVAEPCGPGFTRLLSGACLPLPIVPPVVVLPGCPDGRPRLFNGRCPSVTCPLNAPFNPVSGRCQPILGAACPPGQVKLSHRGPCVPAGGGCPGRLVRDVSGKCVVPGLIGKPELQPCAPGQRRVSGACVGPVAVPSGPVIVPGRPSIACPGNLVPDGRGRCVPRGLLEGRPQIPPTKGSPVVVPPVGQVPPRGGPIVVPPRGGSVPPVGQVPPKSGPIVVPPRGGGVPPVGQTPPPKLPPRPVPIVKQPVPSKLPSRPPVVVKTPVKPPPRSVPQRPQSRPVQQTPRPKPVTTPPPKKAVPKVVPQSRPQGGPSRGGPGPR